MSRTPPPRIDPANPFADGLSPAARREEPGATDAARLRREAREELENLVQARTAELLALNASLATEIEQRRRAEALAERHERALRALGACNEALVRAVDEQALLAEVCRIAVEVGGYLLCWVGFAEDDERRSVRPVAASGYDDGYVAAADVVWSDTERGRGPVGRAIRTGKPQVARRISQDPTFAAWRAQAERRGFASMIAIPLVAEGHTLGALAIYAADVEALGDDREVTLLVELADDLAFGIAALRGRAERARMTGRLMQADRLAAVGTLAAGVAHEINNPLAYLLGGLDFVERELAAAASQLPNRLDEARSVLAEMRVGGERIRQIVRDLKTFSRADDEELLLHDVRRIAESSINLARSEISRRARVIREYGPVPAVRANEARLGQVLLNLLVNAAQAFDPGSRAAGNEIRVRTRAEPDDRVVVEVADTGKGIAPAILARIFEPFFTTKPVGVGTGLGLWICRNLVSAIDGEIEVESRVGEGSTFRVILPAARRAAEPPPPGVSAPATRARVLVVDDEALVAKAVQRTLAEEHEVVVETSPRAALSRLLSGERFGAILCDLMMPEMSGMELHAALVASRPADARRLAFLTGGAFTAEAARYLDSVANVRVEKPFDAAVLRGVVRGLLATPAAG